ncbi:MAG: hypothetical protein E5V79_03105, partial [Mesorhizobium sp.]
MIDFWFSIGSTYTYLSVMRLAEVQAETGIEFRWRPFNVRSIMISASIGKAGRKPESVLRQADSDAAKADLAAATEQAKSLGIFGSPNFVVDGELFWGDDRLDDAMRWHRQIES